MREFLNTQEVKDAVEKLKQHLNSLSNKKFALDLIRFYENKGGLSESQFKWVINILEEKPASIFVGKMESLQQMFDKAAEKLDIPGFTLKIDDMGEVNVCQAENTDAAVEVWLRLRNNKYKYYGKVTKEGNFQIYNTYVKSSPKLIEVLKGFNDDPLNTAVKYGKLTGVCCFCNSGLSDPRSLEVGYGATCARNYNLPY